MTTKPTLADVKQKASTKSDEDLQQAVGSAGNAMDSIVQEIWDDPSLDTFQKMHACELLRTNARNIMQMAVQGAMSSSPIPLGGGGSNDAPTGDSQETVSKADYDRVSGELETAQAAVRVLTKDRTALEQITNDLGVTGPPNSSTPFPADTRQRVAAAVAEIEQKATDEATPANTVDAAKVKAAYDKIVAAFKGLSTSWASTEIKGEDALDKALDDLEKLLS